jgi:hypothetical protein
MLTNPLVFGFGCRFKLDNVVPLPSLIPGLLARPFTPFIVGSRERPSSPNFLQLYIVGPSSGFNKGLRSASIMSPFKTNWPFVLCCRQFPVQVTFAITINKSQNHTLNNVGIYLSSPVYSHGQMYVAISRVTSSANIKIFNGQGPDGYMRNVDVGNVVCNCNFVICTVKCTHTFTSQFVFK